MKNRINQYSAGGYVKFGDEYIRSPKNMEELENVLLEQNITREDFVLYIAETINREAWEEYIPDLIAVGLVDTINVNGGMVSYNFETGFDASPLGEMVEIPIAKPMYGKVSLKIQKFGIGVAISNETIEDVQSFDMVSRQINLAMDACRRYEDKQIMKTLLNGPSDGSDDWYSGQHVTNHILSATDVTWSGTSGVLDWEKIQVCLSIGRAEDIPYETMVIHPFVFTSLMLMDEFKSANVWQVLPPAQQATLARGGLYPIAGIDIVVTPWMDMDKVLFLNRRRYGVRFMRRPLSVDRESIVSHDSMAIYLTSRMGVGIVNPDAAVRLDDVAYIDPANYVTAA